MTEDRRDQPESPQSSEPDRAEEETARENEALARPSGQIVVGDAAREAFPLQVDAALAYAADNKYEYGPAYSKRDLAWNVVAAQEMRDGIVRVTLDYHPEASFKGDSGREYIDMAPDGSVLARRQLKRPKESLPWVLIGFATFSVMLAFVVVPLVWFYENTGDPLYVSGRILYLRADKPKVQESINYTGPDVSGNVRNWAISPQGSNTELAFVKISLINATAGSVRIVVDTDAAELRTNNGTFKPLDATARAQSTGSINPRMDVPGFIPVWGSLNLESNQVVEGYMVFEVPRDSTFSEFRWSATDSAVVRYD